MMLPWEESCVEGRTTRGQETIFSIQLNRSKQRELVKGEKNVSFNSHGTHLRDDITSHCCEMRPQFRSHCIVAVHIRRAPTSPAIDGSMVRWLSHCDVRSSHSIIHVQTTFACNHMQVAATFVYLLRGRGLGKNSLPNTCS
jgi:hypothetical protein